MWIYKQERKCISTKNLQDIDILQTIAVTLVVDYKL